MISVTLERREGPVGREGFIGREGGKAQQGSFKEAHEREGIFVT